MTLPAGTGDTTSSVFSFHGKPELFAGLHALDHLPLELHRSRCSSPFVMYRDDREGKHLYKLLLKSLKGTRVQFTGCLLERTDKGLEHFMELCSRFTSEGCNGIIALGGGMVQMQAKLLNAAVSYSLPIQEAPLSAEADEFLRHAVSGSSHAYPLFSVLTDILEGTEAGGTAGLEGYSLSHPALAPDSIFIDSRGYVPGPADRTAQTALFALAQFIEAVRPEGTNPLVEVFVRSGMISLHHGIMRMQSVEGRHAAACAAVYASIAQANTPPGPLTSLAALCRSSGLASQAEAVHALLPDMLKLMKSRYGSAMSFFSTLPVILGLSQDIDGVSWIKDLEQRAYAHVDAIGSQEVIKHLACGVSRLASCTHAGDVLELLDYALKGDA